MYFLNSHMFLKFIFENLTYKQNVTNFQQFHGYKYIF